MIQDVVVEIIDTVQNSKRDVLSTALVARSWVSRSRRHLAVHHWPDLQLKSFEEILDLARLLRSPNCTLVSLNKTFEHLNLESSPTTIGPLRLDSAALLGEGIFPFLRTTDVSCSLKIDLDHLFLQPTEISPFPWDVISNWKNLSYMSITAVLPSLDMLTSILFLLQSLHTVELDVEYLDSSVSPPTELLPKQLRELHLGPRGYALFSWLATLPRNSILIETMYLVVGEEDLASFHMFARSRTHQHLSYLEVRLRKDCVAGMCEAVGAARITDPVVAI
ncbi:hypothetical protein FA13DRAFT_1797593 [Coprinellus micaceus]|uniref:F-box domain-containing protein n=1 Tax=Coprinellus micaceus TaxID=71717 RepID=A0A4Y7SQB9_COPMI|nr:hypothetical protein FA13DRAFT_1797593 [Coprinellus micaceus]